MGATQLTALEPVATEKKKERKSKYLLIKLKAGRPHLCNYPHTPTDYRHTDKHIRLVMTPYNDPLLFLHFCRHMNCQL